jgi:hypothetical protein
MNYHSNQVNEALAKSDLIILRQLIRSTRSSLIKVIVVGLTAIFLVPFFPSRYSIKSLSDQIGYLPALGVCAVFIFIFLVFFIHTRISTIKKLQSDVKYNSKRRITIIGDDFNGKPTDLKLTIESLKKSKTQDLKEFFDDLKTGDTVVIEYAVFSRILLKAEKLSAASISPPIRV